jgi:hypothetical protein
VIREDLIEDVTFSQISEGDVTQMVRAEEALR